MWVCDSSLFLDEILYQYSDFELGMNGWKSLMGIVSFTYLLFLFSRDYGGDGGLPDANKDNCGKNIF